MHKTLDQFTSDDSAGPDHPTPRPTPMAELEMLFESGDELIDRREIPDSGLSLSDITDWPYVGVERQNSGEEDHYEDMMNEIDPNHDDETHSEQTETNAYVCEHCGADTDDTHRLEDGDTVLCGPCWEELDHGNTHADKARAVADGGAKAVQAPDPVPDFEHRDDGKPVLNDEWIGEVFFESWGYGQTNVDLIQIVDVSESGRTVLAKRCCAERVDTSRSSESLAPTGETYGDEFRLHVREGGEKIWLKGTYPMNRDGDIDGPTRKGSFMPWGDQESVHQTAPGYGH